MNDIAEEKKQYSLKNTFLIIVLGHVPVFLLSLSAPRVASLLKALNIRKFKIFTLTLGVGHYPNKLKTINFRRDYTRHYVCDFGINK